jgi:AcrR family transcriptional regulator
VAVSRTPRGRWVEEGLRALGDGGLDAVRIESLAQAIGVTKGGFYWHFADRGALLDEVLDAWERVNLEDVIEAVERDGGDARARLRRLFGLAFAGTGALRTDLAVREWAWRDPAVAERVRRVDNQRMEYLRGLFGALGGDEAEVEVRCLMALSLWIGNHFIAADHKGRSRAEVLERAARLLEGSGVNQGVAAIPGRPERTGLLFLPDMSSSSWPVTSLRSRHHNRPDVPSGRL